MAAWQQAEADVDMARIDLVYTKVLAPISGRVGRSLVTEGGLVSNGQPQALATIQQIDPIHVDLTQSSTEILRLQRAVAEGGQAMDKADANKVKLKLEAGSGDARDGTLKISYVRKQ